MLSRTCLVVDDEPSVRAYIKAIVTRSEFETLQAEGGVNALRLAEELGERLDLIVSDIEMPDGDGLTFVRSARMFLPTVPIVLISGSNNFDPANRPAGFCEFLPKPFSPRMLVEAIDRATQGVDQGAKDRLRTNRPLTS
jgi:DNA-binding NtrC family response regulator